MLLAAILCAQDPAALLADLQRTLREPPPLAIEATLSRTEALTWESWLAEGTLVVDAAHDAFRVDVTLREPRAETERSITLFRADGGFVFLDHTARTITRGDDPLLAGLGSRMAWDMARVLPVDPGLLLDAGAPRLGEPLALGGVRCRTVLAKTPDGPTAHLWYVAEADGLPRLWETTRELGAGDTLRKRMTFRNVERGAAPALAPDEYAGYAEREPLAWADPEARARAADAGAFTTLAGGVGALRERFNAAKDHVRAVGVFAPS
jgi:hypothetical protein